MQGRDFKFNGKSSLCIAILVTMVVQPLSGQHRSQTESGGDPDQLAAPSQAKSAKTEGRAPDQRHILVLAVEFRDRRSTVPIEHLDSLMNHYVWDPVTERGGFRDYYIENSYGKFAPWSHVHGWIEAQHSYSFYADTLDQRSAAELLVDEALRHVRVVGIDLSAIENNAVTDERSEAVVLVTSDFVAAHFDRLRPPVTIRNVTFRSYAIQELDLGAIVHEYGHALGLKDLHESTHPFGFYDVMSRSWKMRSAPGHFTAYSKYLLGWIDPEVIVEPVRGLDVPNSHDQPFAVLVRGRHGTEWSYFLIENRVKKGYDAGRNGTVTGSGLLIYHISDRSTDWGHVEQADGLGDLEEYGSSKGAAGNRGDPGDFFPGSTLNTRFTDWTNPSSRTEGGASTGVSITNISAPGDTMTFDVDFVEPSTATGVRQFSSVSRGAALHQNYPNPFTMSTTIEYEIPFASDVKLEIFDSAGRSVATLEAGIKSAGLHRVVFAAGSLSAGRYFCRLRVGEAEFVQSLVLVR